MAEPETPPAPARRLGAKLRLARLALAWEKLWPNLWPAVGVAGLFLAVALTDVLPLLSPWAHAAVLAAFAAAFLWFLVRAAVRFGFPGGFPGRAAARRRIEQASGLDHRPLTAIEDALAAGSDDPRAAALWRLHQRRMADAIRRLRIGWPRPHLARHDPYALRGALLLLLVVTGALGWSDAGDRLARAISPEFPASPPKTVALDLWISPPAYTGLAPLFPLRMTEAAQREAAAKAAANGKQAKGDGKGPDDLPPVTLKVPTGSTLTAQIHAEGGLPRLRRDHKVTPFVRIDDSHSRLETKLNAGGDLLIEQGGTTLGRWRLDIAPDQPPEIAFADPPTATPQATLRLSFTAGDDYGIASAKAEIRRAYEKGTVIGKEVQTIDLPLPGRNAKTAKETSFFDLAPNKWAGLPVVIELVATDALGQTGRSRRKAITLPERVFNNPVARAIIEQRRRLMDQPDRREPVAEALEDIAARPGAYNDDTVVFLSLISARSRLRMDPDDAAEQSVVDLLWDTALRLEDGRLSIAERDLRKLQEQLQKALARNAPDAELQRLMNQLQSALNRYLQALAQEMMKKGRQQKDVVDFDPSTMRLMDMNDFQRMLDQMREMMRSGARDAARQMLSRLQQMLESMRSMQIVRMRGGAMNRGAMGQLQNLIRRQQQLMDRTFRQQNQPGRQGSGMPTPGDQRALQQMLRQLRGMMPGQQRGQQQGQSGPGPFFDRADEAMGRAAQALEQGRPGDAVGPQGEALDQLRRAGREAMQQMMDRFARQSGTDPNRGKAAGRLRRDPLGREIMGEDVDSSDITIPDQSTMDRAREILDELRRRAGDSNRPRIELDYINRLLEQF